MSNMDALVLGLITAAALIGSILICKIEIAHKNRKLHTVRIRVGGVELTEQACNYVIGRMKDRIMSLTAENEELSRKLWAANVRLSHIDTVKPSISWEDFRNEKAS